MGVIADDSSSIYFGTLLRGDLFGIFCLILLLWSGGFGDDFEQRRLFRGSSIQRWGVDAVTYHTRGQFAPPPPFIPGVCRFAGYGRLWPFTKVKQKNGRIPSHRASQKLSIGSFCMKLCTLLYEGIGV